MTSLREAFGDDYSCINKDRTAGCEPGQFCTSRATCQSCPAGYACLDDKKNMCGAGMYSGSGASECISCSAGTYNSVDGCANGEECCIPCSLGKYSEIQGASECLNCPSGQTTEKTASTSSASCVVGSWCTSGCDDKKLTEYCSGETKLPCWNCRTGQGPSFTGCTTESACPFESYTGPTGIGFSQWWGGGECRDSNI